MKSVMPPLINSERQQFPLWACLTDDEQSFLRSYCKKSWKPPEFHFVAYNIGAFKYQDGGGDYRNKLPMAQKPNDRYQEAR